MIRVTERSIFSALIFLVACVALIQTQDMRSDVALVPKMVAVLLLIFSGIQVLVDLFPSVKKALSFLDRKSTSEQSTSGEGVAQEGEDSKATLWERYLFFGWVAGYILLIYLTSMIWATLISLFVYLRWFNKETWLMSALYSLGTTLFIYVVFVLGFKLQYFL